MNNPHQCPKCGYPEQRNPDGSVTHYKGIYDIRKPCDGCGAQLTHEAMRNILRKLIEVNKSTEQGRRKLARGAAAFLRKYREAKDARDEETLLMAIEVLDILATPLEKTNN